MVNRETRLACLAALVLAVAAVTMSAQAPATEAVSAKTWVGHAPEFENFLRTAPITGTKPLSIGVTKSQRAFFAPGGPMESAAWKALTPGYRNGFYESYKSEIAAYELDKVFLLNMVPPKVERRVDGQVGVAIMWVSPTKSFHDLGGAPKVPPAQTGSWNAQLVRAKMFHNLIGDIDPNLGNWLVDPAWNLILIDHSRALTTRTNLVHEMQGNDAELWAKMMALTEESLTQSVGQWLGKNEIKALLQRRGKMQAAFEKPSRRP